MTSLGKGLAEELGFGQVGEPLEEGGLVGRSVEAKEVGSAVLGGIGLDGGGGQGEGLRTADEGDAAGRRMAARRVVGDSRWA